MIHYFVVLWKLDLRFSSLPVPLVVSSRAVINNFIFSKLVFRNVPKFTAAERTFVKSLVATLSIKRIPDAEIIKEIETRTQKTMSQRYLTSLKQLIKRDSFHWYKTLRQGEYDFIHEFKERINEIIDLQKRHYNIIEDNTNNPSIQQTSLAELHKLNITLSNYFDIAPYIIPKLGADLNGNSISTTQQAKEIIV